MVFAEIRDRIERLIELAGWTNVSPGPDPAFLANEGLRLFTQEAQHNVEDVTITTAVGTATYSLLGASDLRSWVTLFDDASYGTTVPIYQTTRQDLRTADRLWRQASNAQPNWWYWHSPTKVGLFPKPSTASITCYFQGVRHEPVMTADTDAPLASQVFHEGICLYGAWYFGKLYARGDDRSVLEGYLAEAVGYAQDCKATIGAQEAKLISRSVAVPARHYMNVATSFP